MDGIVKTSNDTAKATKLRRIQDRFHKAETYESPTRVLEKDDMRFANADPDHPDWQWPVAVYRARNMQGEVPRPCIVVNKVRQHNLQVVNDMRENKPSVTVHATGFGATSEGAQVYQDIIRYIEYQSNAGAVYTAATRSQVDFGIGYWRVITEYPNDDTFDQEIYLRPVKDPHSVYLDPDAQEPDKSDARWGMIFRDMPRDQFEAEYPQYKDLSGAQSIEGERSMGWSDKSTVRIAEYYERSSISDTLWEVPPDLVHAGHPGGMLRESKMIDGLPEAMKTAGHQSREVEDHRVTWTMIVGDEIVEEQDTAFAYIPIVPLIGEEVVIDGKLDRRGHTRALKDAQRMYNYNASAAIEFGALQTKVPWLVDNRAIEGFEDYWKTANTQNHAYLPWNPLDDSGQPTVKEPTRNQPPVSAPIYMEAMQIAEQQMMIASGQYQAQMGGESNERTGIAIQERQRQGDKATYHFIDNLGMAIAYTGRILVDLIPKVMDTKRVIMILGEDGTRSQVQIDPTAAQSHAVLTPPQSGQTAPGQPPQNGQSAPGAPMQPGQPPQPNPQHQGGENLDASIIFNPNIGRYAVEAEMGPAFATKREQAFNAFQQIIAQNAQLAPIIGDLMFKAADFPMADEIAERLHNLVPAQALGGPSPQEQQMQAAIQHLTQVNTQLQSVNAQTIKELADEKARQKIINADKSGKVSIEQFRAETDRIEALTGIDPDMFVPLIRATVLQALKDQFGGSAPIGMNLPHPNAPPAPPPLDPNANPQGTSA
jgi:hypothetical protein